MAYEIHINMTNSCSRELYSDTSGETSKCFTRSCHVRIFLPILRNSLARSCRMTSEVSLVLPVKKSWSGDQNCFTDRNCQNKVSFCILIERIHNIEDGQSVACTQRNLTTRQIIGYLQVSIPDIMGSTRQIIGYLQVSIPDIMGSTAELKMIHFAWTGIHQKILAADNLPTRGGPSQKKVGVGHVTVCCVCLLNEETSIYLVIYCKFAKF
jgi:hypothetical protein